MKVLDLFSGIGGFSLGLERAGMETVAFVERDLDCQMVLRKHWPGKPIFDDITKLNCGITVEGYPWINQSDFPSYKYLILKKPVDLISLGFPCQDISVGGSQKGITKGTRSSLWKEAWRIINAIRPKYAIIENVERLRKNGLGIVLNDLSKIGYNAEWHCLTARSIGLPHQRDRLFIIAYDSQLRLHEHIRERGHIQTDKEWQSQEVHTERQQCKSESGEVCQILSKRHIDSIRTTYSSQFSIVPELCRVTDGVPSGVHETERKTRIKQLGNAVIPQIPELIGRALMEHEESLKWQ